MFNHILVPLDGSELAERALPSVEHIARVTGAHIHLTRVFESPIVSWVTSPTYVPGPIYDDLIAAETQEAIAYLTKVRDRFVANGIDARYHVLEGDVSAALLDYEKQHAIDLVVMCSHGRSGLARFATGSVADRLLYHGTAPTLLLRAFGPSPILRHALLPLDGSARSQDTLYAVHQLAHTLVQEVTLLHVAHDQAHAMHAEDHLQSLAHQLQGEALTCHIKIIPSSDAAAAIIEEAGTDKLVIMTAHGRSDLTRWALGSTADRVARGSMGPVLLLRQGMPHT